MSPYESFILGFPEKRRQNKPYFWKLHSFFDMCIVSLMYQNVNSSGKTANTNVECAFTYYLWLIGKEFSIMSFLKRSSLLDMRLPFKLGLLGSFFFF